ncbi:hypothetical protein Leryth_000615 [Lithospermum erythrorhizon]|nr:hypothetical protein Leryth_000615 [Lithospermum erythrorhizon]
MHPYTFIFFLFYLSINPTFSHIHVSPQRTLLQNPNISQCPLNFTILTNLKECSAPLFQNNSTVRCQYLRLGLRLLLSSHLRLTNLPPPLPTDSVELTKPPQHPFIGDFDIRATCQIRATWISQGCLNITTRDEFEARVERSALGVVRSACNQTLEGSACGACITSIVNLQASSLRGELIGNISDCSAYATIYAAAIANPYGPADLTTARCLCSGVWGVCVQEEIERGEELWEIGELFSGVGSGIEGRARPQEFLRNALGVWGEEWKRSRRRWLEVFKNLSAGGSETFRHELEIIASVRHVNLLGLIGFGVVLLELLTGKKALMASDDGQVTLLTDWVWSLVKEGRALDVIEDMQEMDPPEVMEKYVMIAVLCSHTQLYARPTMTEVVKLLDNDIPVPVIPDRPAPFVANTNDLERSVSNTRSGPPVSSSS